MGAMLAGIPGESAAGSVCEWTEPASRSEAPEVRPCPGVLTELAAGRREPVGSQGRCGDLEGKLAGGAEGRPTSVRKAWGRSHTGDGSERLELNLEQACEIYLHLLVLGTSFVCF